MDQKRVQSQKKVQVLPRNYRAFFLRTLLYLVILIALVYLLQGWLIYQPERYPVSDLIQVAQLYSVELWPSADEDYRGLVSSRATGQRGTVIVFHGNAGSAFHRLHYLEALERLGFRVVLAEYPGYGAREGHRSERALLDDSRSTLRWAERDFGEPLFLWGESLGCGVATALAADSASSVEGLALITPFTSLPDMAQAIYRLYPARWLVRDRYDSIENLRGYRGPVAILVAEDDEIVPREQAQRLYDSLSTEKQMWVFEDAGHNSWPAGPEEIWWEEVTDFLGSRAGDERIQSTGETEPAPPGASFLIGGSIRPVPASTGRHKSPGLKTPLLGKAEKWTPVKLKSGHLWRSRMNRKGLQRQ